MLSSVCDRGNMSADQRDILRTYIIRLLNNSKISKIDVNMQRTSQFNQKLEMEQENKELRKCICLFFFESL